MRSKLAYDNSGSSAGAHPLLLGLWKGRNRHCVIGSIICAHIRMTSTNVTFEMSTGHDPDASATSVLLNPTRQLLRLQMLLRCNM